jgi:hypothetical protein
LLEVELEEKQELEQELHYANQDLVKMAEELGQSYKTKQLNFKQAKELAKTLVGEESVARALTKLLSAIYNETVSPEELPNLHKITHHCNLSSQSDRHNFHEDKGNSAAHQRSISNSETFYRLRAQYNELGARFIASKAQFSRLKSQLTNLNNTQKNFRELRRLQSEERRQRSKEYIEESKTLIGNRAIFLVRETNPPTGIVARQHNQVEQQSEIVNTMQKKVDKQNIEERKERE